MHELALFAGGGGSCLAGLLLAGAPAALSSLIPTACRLACQTTRRTCWSPSPSGTTSTRLTGIPGAATSTLLRQASPASHGVLPENEQANRTSVTSGLTPTACFAKYDPATHCLRTFQGSLFSPICDEYSQTVPPHGMMQSGQCWELATWVLPTAGNGSGYSWPTPHDGWLEGQTSQHEHGFTSVSLPQHLASTDVADARRLGLEAGRPPGEPAAAGPIQHGESECGSTAVADAQCPERGPHALAREQDGNSFYHNGTKVQPGYNKLCQARGTPTAHPRTQTPRPGRISHNWRIRLVGS